MFDATLPTTGPAPDPASETLLRVFGHRAFRGSQRDIVDHVVAGGDAVVLMPTGGGKSLCYQLPALLRPGTAIVVSPLIALMQDQVAALRQVGVPAAFLNSSLAPAAAAQVAAEARRGGLRLLYVAPERLLTPGFAELAAQMADPTTGAGISLIAIDEAHCVSQWGHDFRPEYIRLTEFTRRFPGVPRIALTATADALTRREIAERLDLTAAPMYVSSFDRPNITYRVVDRDRVRDQLLAFIQGEHRGQAGIVYCASRVKTEETAAWLRDHGIPALPYHAGLPAAEREQTQARFQREDGLVIAATIAFGMGIDKPDVRFVAHIDMPKSLEGYYQETGRAGRDGEPAVAWMAYGMQDVMLHQQRIEQSEADAEHRRVESMKLRAMLGYCEASTCRRQILLDYFGEHIEPCGNCDVCRTPPELWDATIAAQKLLSAAVRSGQRFGVGHLSDILLGKVTPNVTRHGHDELPTFGVGTELDRTAWAALARHLTATGALMPDPARHGGLRLTVRGQQILRGEETVQARRHRPAAASRNRSRGARGVGAGAGTGPGSAVSGVALDPVQEAVAEALRAERRQLAEAQSVPAYVIMNNATLLELARLQPHDRTELLQVSGIGEARAERYGDAILATIASALAPAGLPPTEAPEPPEDPWS